MQGVDVETYCGIVKSKCNNLELNYCRAVEAMAISMYYEGYTTDEVISQVQISANNLTNFSLGS